MSAAFKVFFDTELLEHKTGYGVEAVSIGMVSETGSELYVVFNDFAADVSNPWTREHVLKKLPDPAEWKSPAAIRNEIEEWILTERRQTSSPSIEFWAKNGSYDNFILCQTLGGMRPLKEFMRIAGFENTDFRDTNELRRQTLSLKLSEQPEAEKHISINDARWERKHFGEMSSFLASVNPV